MSVRSRFDELKTHLAELAARLGVPKENFDDSTAKMEIRPGGHNETEDGIHFADVCYAGSLYVERLTAPQAFFLALAARAWLDEHDDTRYAYKLGEIEVDFIRLDDGILRDLMLTADFVDPVHLVEIDALTPDDAPRLAWNGREYALAEYDLWVAERCSVSGKLKTEAQL